MPSLVQPTVKIDATKLNRGFELAREYSKTAPADACNFTAKEVAFGAYQNTPVTTAERVNREFLIDTQPKIGVRGKPSKNKRILKGGKVVDYTRGSVTTTVPLAVLIAQARANSNSKYNQLTGFRYYLPRSPYATGKGGRAAGRAAMASLIDSMLKGRRRAASGFIRAGWLASMKRLKSLVPARYRKNSDVDSGGQNVEALGTVIPAKKGDAKAFCQIENDVGMDNKNPSQNRALMEKGTPALQIAMDRQGQREMDFFLRKSGKEDLETPVNKEWA
jgi:hypothetical protein